MTAKAVSHALQNSVLFPQPPLWLHVVRPPYRPAGWASVIDLLRLNCPPPVSPMVVAACGSYPIPLAPPIGWRTVPPDDLVNCTSLEEHLALAMQLEGPNLSVLGAALAHPRHGERVAEAILRAVQLSPASGWARRLWFLYEWLTGKPLPLDDVSSSVEAIDLLDPVQYFTSPPVLSVRHQVHDNLLGVPQFCPTVRRTPTLERHSASHYGLKAERLLARGAPGLPPDAAYDLVLQETVHSMVIEGVSYKDYDLPRLMATLLHHGNEDGAALDEAAVRRVILPALLGPAAIPGVTDKYRQEQVYVSETICTVDDTKDLIHFVAAKAGDCPKLMAGLFAMMRRVTDDLVTHPGGVDPVVVASVLAFGFVFIHPFEDGNGRVHRFLIQQALRRFGYVGKMLFPISSVIIREPEKYSACLKSFDQQSLPYILYTLTGDGCLTVLNDTSHLYRYFDGTAMAEFLYGCLRACVEEELPAYCSRLKVPRQNHPSIL